jgi:hypothetical protein
MQYEPIKKSLGRVFSGSLFMRKTLYFLLDLLLLRTWHVKRALRKISREFPGKANVLGGPAKGELTECGAIQGNDDPLVHLHPPRGRRIRGAWLQDGRVADGAESGYAGTSVGERLRGRRWRRATRR